MLDVELQSRDHQSDMNWSEIKADFCLSSAEFPFLEIEPIIC